MSPSALTLRTDACRAMSHSRGATAGGGARRRASSGSTGSCLTTAPSAPVAGTQDAEQRQSALVLGALPYQGPICHGGRAPISALPLASPRKYPLRRCQAHRHFRALLCTRLACLCYACKACPSTCGVRAKSLELLCCPARPPEARCHGPVQVPRPAAWAARSACWPRRPCWQRGTRATPRARACAATAAPTLVAATLRRCAIL